MSLDFLKGEIAAKRKTIEEDKGSLGRPTKYVRRGELQKAKEIQAVQARPAELSKSTPSASKEHTPAPKEDSMSNAIPQTSSETGYNIPNEEVIRRLRAKGQPIRLFDESDKDRRLRLRALELIEEKEGNDRHGGQNDFKKALEDVESSEREKRARNDAKKGEASGSGNSTGETTGLIDLGLVKTDPDKLYPLIYYALKKTLREWGEAMDERPEHVKRSTQGKLAAATQVQSAQSLKPLFKQIRSRSLPSDMLARMSEIVYYMQTRQYQKANDSYLRLSIGNAPWPIGVTMVGIHERSAREKISSDQVAHVLNDEVSRKYIQSLKRILTFSQTKYPPEDISQLMG